MACAGTAEAQRPATLGEGAPVGQSGIQLYNFSSYISNGQGDPTPPAPTTQEGRVERVFQFLQSRGIKDVELYNYNSALFPGTNPATPLNVARACRRCARSATSTTCASPAATAT